MTRKEGIKRRHQALVARRQLLIQRLKKMDEEQLRFRPSAEKWNVMQILAHTHLSEQGTLAYIRKKLKYSPNGLPNAPMISHLRTRLLQLTLYSPLKFKAPAGLDRFEEPASLEEIEAAWNITSEGFDRLINELDDHMLGWALFKHPIIGRIDMLDTVKFMVSHYIHHERQIDALML